MSILARAGRWALDDLRRIGGPDLIVTSVPLVRPTPRPWRSITVADPGNPTCRLYLEDSTLTGDRELVCVNATPEADGSHIQIRIPVDPRLTDPYAAAAWTYDDPAHPVRTTRDAYIALERRT